MTLPQDNSTANTQDCETWDSDAYGNARSVIWRVVARLVKWTGLAVYVGAFLLTACAFVFWLIATIHEFTSWTSFETKDCIHKLLSSIEMLLLVPIPGIIGIVVYHTLCNISDAHDPHLKKSYDQVVLAKNILAGFLITVTGTTLLDLLASEEPGIEPFIGGFLLMLGLTVYTFASRRALSQECSQKDCPNRS